MILLIVNGTTYSNPEFYQKIMLQLIKSGGCNPLDHYWHECKAYTYVDGEYDSNVEMWIITMILKYS